MTGPTLLAEPHGSASAVRWAGRGLRALTSLALGLAVAFVAIAVLGPMVLPYRTFVVRSGSMRPTMEVGSLAFYRPAPAADLGPGDVIAFARPGGTGEMVTHRVVAVEQDGGRPTFVTKGDANGQPDDWRVPAAGTGWRYRFSVPGAGYVLVALGSGQGRQLVLIAVVAVAVFVVLAWIWRPKRAAAPAPAPQPSVAGEGEAELRLADSLTTVLGLSHLLLRTVAADDPVRTDAEALHTASERAVAAFGALNLGPDTLTSRSGSPLPEPSPGDRNHRRPLRSSGGRVAHAR